MPGGREPRLPIELTLCSSYMVLLSGLDISIDLRIVGYESELAAGDSRDVTDWLVTQGIVADGTETRVYDGISLDVEDALELADWLQAAAAGDATASAGEVRPGALLQFAEPDIAVQLITQDRSTTTTRWSLYDPAGPVISVGYTTLNARVLDLVSPRAHFQSCADAWGEELAAFLGR